jgi:hypothetical protein
MRDELERMVALLESAEKRAQEAGKHVDPFVRGSYQFGALSATVKDVAKELRNLIRREDRVLAEIENDRDLELDVMRRSGAL